MQSKLDLHRLTLSVPFRMCTDAMLAWDHSDEEAERKPKKGRRRAKKSDEVTWYENLEVETRL